MEDKIHPITDSQIDELVKLARKYGTFEGTFTDKPGEQEKLDEASDDLIEFMKTIKSLVLTDIGMMQ